MPPKRISSVTGSSSSGRSTPSSNASSQSLEPEERRIRRVVITQEEIEELRTTAIHDINPDPPGRPRPPQRPSESDEPENSQSLTKSQPVPQALPRTRSGRQIRAADETPPEQTVAVQPIADPVEQTPPQRAEPLATDKPGSSVKNTQPEEHASSNPSEEREPAQPTEPSYPAFIQHRNLRSRLPDPQDIKFTADEWEEIYNLFPTAEEIIYDYPYFIFIAATPPENPITVKGLIVEFYLSRKEYSHMPGQFGRPDLPDPLPAVQWSHKLIPSPGELEMFARSLEFKLEIEVATCAFYHNSFVIELDEEFYVRERLPGRVAGKQAYWGVVGEVWGLKPTATARHMIP